MIIFYFLHISKATHAQLEDVLCLFLHGVTMFGNKTDEYLLYFEKSFPIFSKGESIDGILVFYHGSVVNSELTSLLWEYHLHDQNR